MENRRADDGRIAEILVSVTHIKDKVDRLDESVNGNGRPGLKIRLDRVEQREKLKNWALGIIFATFLGLFIKDLYALLGG